MPEITAMKKREKKKPACVGHKTALSRYVRLNKSQCLKAPAFFLIVNLVFITFTQRLEHDPWHLLKEFQPLTPACTEHGNGLTGLYAIVIGQNPYKYRLTGLDLPAIDQNH